MSYGTDLTELSAQIETARAALAAVEQLARQLQQRAEAERARAEAEAQRTKLSGDRTVAAQLEQTVPPLYAPENPGLRFRGSEAASRSSAAEAGRSAARTPTNGRREARQPEVAMPRLFA